MFYLIEIVNYNNGAPVSKGIYEYTTERAAMADYHLKMGGSMKNTNYASELLMVISDTGEIIVKDYFVRPVKAEEE